MSFEIKTLGEVCSVGDGAHSKVQRVESGIPYLTSKNIGEGILKLDKLDFISEESFEKLFSKESKATRRPQAGDVLFGIIGSFGNTYRYKESDHFGFSSSIGILRPDPKQLDSEYLYYVVSSKKFRDNHANHNAGSVQGYTNIPTVKGLHIPVPSLNVQRKISQILSSLDYKIQLNTQTNQTLEEMAQAIFKSWFVDFDPVKAKMNGEQPEGMDAATASLFPDKLVESELGDIPEGWDIDTVGRHLKLIKGKSYKSSELQDSDTALVTLKSFKRGGGYRMDGLKEYTGTYKPEQVIEAGELVMSLTDVTQAAEIVGKPALVIDAPQYDKLVASLDVAILRTKDINAKLFFYGLMCTYRFQRYAESFATGTTVLHLSSNGITSFKFVRPNPSLVKKYQEFCAPIFSKIEANILESQQLEKLRDALLPKLLSGEIELGTSEELVEAI
ncbi:restriction endonuclease subunit S [Vibrio metschnikovii]|nr:restriction endonuclease subunit S [Vibrio metschnikovii]